ncbi:hypothetical protein J6590_107276, partial [Homalodisca vitripennis]
IPAGHQENAEWLRRKEKEMAFSRSNEFFAALDGPNKQKYMQRQPLTFTSRRGRTTP